MLLATISQHPEVVTILTGDRRVNILLRNNEGYTALDIAEGHNENKEPTATFPQVQNHEKHGCVNFRRLFLSLCLLGKDYTLTNTILVF